MLSQQGLKYEVHYDPKTGIFTRRLGKAAGRILGYEDHGYYRAHIGGKKYYLHQLAFLYMDGYIPQIDIDHADLDGLNNKWTNLRPAGKSYNGANRPLSSRNTSGFKGVSRCEVMGAWQASICRNGKSYNLGNRFKTPEEAAQAYNEAALKFFGEFARGNEIAA